MTRSVFSILCSALLTVFLVAEAEETKQIAITFDDLPASNISVFGDQVKVNKEILRILEKYEVEATGFVITHRLYGKGDILNLWLKAGHTLGNHTHTHMDFDEVDAAAFQTDINKGASEMAKVLSPNQLDFTYFRFPYLHQGNTLEKKTAVRAYLDKKGYTIAPVTINPRDSHYNTLYLKAWGVNDKKGQDSIKAAFLEQVKKKTEEAESLSRELFKRDIRHVLLLHLNRLTATCLDQTLKYYVDSGYSFVSLEQALKDSVYSVEEEYVGSEELTWLERLKRSLKKH